MPSESPNASFQATTVESTQYHMATLNNSYYTSDGHFQGWTSNRGRSSYRESHRKEEAFYKIINLVYMVPHLYQISLMPTILIKLIRCVRSVTKSVISLLTVWYNALCHFSKDPTIKTSSYGSRQNALLLLYILLVCRYKCYISHHFWY